MSIIERIYKISQYKRLSIYRISKLIGVSNGYFGKQRAVKGAVSSNIIENLVNQLPDINPEWLITGKGPMLRPIEVKDEAPQDLEEPHADQETGISVHKQEVIAHASDSKEYNFIIEKLKNDLTEQKQSHEQIMEEKEYVIHSLESRLAHKDRQIEEQKVNCEHVIKEQTASFKRVIEDQKSNFERIIVGRDKQIAALENNLGMVISEKSEVIKMKDQMLKIQAEKIAELEDFKKMQEKQAFKQKRA